MPKRFIDLMEKCWSQHPKDRPAISDIVKELEDMSNAESRQAVQEELPNGSRLCHGDCSQKETADDMRKHNKILESTGNEIDKLIREKDAGNACVFLGLSISLKATEILNNATDVDQNINEILECLKSIAEGAICDLPSKIKQLQKHGFLLQRHGSD
ncbi:C-terminal of Roc, COR, domain [Desmophyllum pertusum]|uniref:C-terminal of Roc, COR, domain n=1 Tax=Desmophyllum pertusum TaxID=174260 RepID=A0A9W9YNK8_9CNID|nr:C-terminal of Roc, COR, domain [Desmophyllum pertusum]